MKRIMIAAALMLVSAQQGAAQWNMSRLEGGRSRIYMSIGLDPAVVTTIGYARVVPVAGHEVMIGSDVGVAGAKFDPKDFRARIELQTSVVKYGAAQASVSAVFITRGTENINYRGLNFGADITGTVGVYKSGFFAAAQFGKDKSIITHVTHTDWYREHFYEDVKDGWYPDTGGTFHYGVAAGVTIGSAELVGRAGMRRTEDFKSLMPPFYGSVGIGFAL